jgi:ABC-type lipoprotein export system ATPase subunit
MEKNKIWKLGCNWESLKPSFFNFIRSEGIVITVNNFPFRPGDLVLITEGFTVYAIALVKNKISPVTKIDAYEEELKKYQIPFEDWVKFASVEWFDLPKSEVFQYKLQQGIRQVHKREIIERATDLWENRKLQDSNLIFYVKAYKEHPSANWKFPCIVLTQTSWNDYGYYTSFNAYYYKDLETRTSFGHVKILMEDETYTQLPKTFTQLTENYISLGQTPQYYHSIEHELPFKSSKLLLSLNDCTFNRRLNYRYQNQPGFIVSLLRNSQAENLFLTGSIRNSDPSVKREYNDFEFSFSHQLPRALAEHRVDFSFTCNEILPNRFFCLIGKNGTGKTKFLSQLAKKLADNNDDGEFFPDRPIFSQVKAISFSLFDNFGEPKRLDVNYELISLKNKEGIFDSDYNNKRLWNSYRELKKDRGRKNQWYQILNSALELHHLNVQTDAFDATNLDDFVSIIDEVFSSGQKITFHFVTRLLATIEEGSIILFDEPETHLHPNIVSRILNTLNIILHQFNSYCIIATHSPVILQEIPSKFVRVFDRQGNTPIIYQPTIECFGENLSNISNAIFHVDREDEIYKHVLKNLVQKMSFDSIMELFNQKLSLNAQLYLKTIEREVEK